MSTSLADFSLNKVAGIDEVGRGPLAGPVVAAAVILPSVFNLQGLTDSKKVSPKARERLNEEIRAIAVDYCIAEASVAEIDELNILQASLLAMRRAVLGLQQTPEHALVDGNKLPKLPCAATAVIGGDLTEPSISAASIIAKVYRDGLMNTYAKQYPGYGLEKHKGYPTRQHLDALLTLGITPIHRRTFGPVRGLLD
ncbi:MAG: ribonuclease HII [Arenicellaceae bacterium]|nr:ribonuclease HII [Arenicellaceae bacterium]